MEFTASLGDLMPDDALTKYSAQSRSEPARTSRSVRRRLRFSSFIQRENIVVGPQSNKCPNRPISKVDRMLTE